MEPTFDLSAYKLATPHADMEAYYIPDFVTPDEEDYLLRKVRQIPRISAYLSASDCPFFFTMGTATGTGML